MQNPGFHLKKAEKRLKKAENQDFPVFDRQTAVLVARLLQVIKILSHWFCPSPLEFFESLFSFFSLFSLFSLFVTYQLSLGAKIANFDFDPPKKAEKTEKKAENAEKAEKAENFRPQSSTYPKRAEKG